MKIGENAFVSLTYTLEVDGEVADQTTEENPLEFIYGAGFLIPAFEENILDLGKGDDFKFTLTPENGYGEIEEEAIIDLPKDIFMVDGKVEEGLLTVGNNIPMSTQEGQRMLGVVKEVGEETVKMDFNHPMAGKTLNFSGQIVGVREVAPEDMAELFSGSPSSSCSSCRQDPSSCGSDC